MTAEQALAAERNVYPEPRELRLQFVGSGSEYFRIWIVNLFLSILTLGIYSAWAKVRREQYFHRNTLLDGSGFDYHGNPKAILKGRVIAVGMVVILSLVGEWAPDYYFPALLLCVLLIPWLLVRSFIFRARNTSFRGLHFDFLGTYKGLCKACLCYTLLLIALLWAMTYSYEMMYGDANRANNRQAAIENSAQDAEFAAIKANPELRKKLADDPDFKEKFVKEMNQKFTTSMNRATVDAGTPWLLRICATWVGVLLLLPVLVHAFQRFRFEHLAFGASRFHIQYRLQSLYGICLLGIWPLVAISCCFALLVLNITLFTAFMIDFSPSISKSSVMFLMSMFFILVAFAWFVTPAYFKALVSNLAWNSASLDRHRFVSDQTYWGITGITLSNWLLILLTLGLYWPWAKVRMAVYRARHAAIRVKGNLDDFLAGAEDEKNATGEELADIFGLDVAL
ncbi:MAG: DUF898 domain-containing protein [Zoogloeaceae bacterium]|jgi:uncharacterized membrane protein YjgN (DUF898 family)|nr:DUF898 domain-containing protein [Zoogloeaceae bacterium]